MPKPDNGRYEAIAENDHVQVYALRSRYGMVEAPVNAVVHKRLEMDDRARFALTCIEKWGSVAAGEAGEDTAGRQKLRRLTPHEIVEHACACTELAFAEFQERGWSFSVPDYSVMVDRVKQQEDHND